MWGGLNLSTTSIEKSEENLDLIKANLFFVKIRFKRVFSCSNLIVVSNYKNQLFFL